MSVTRSQQFARFTAFTIATSLLMSASVYAQQSVTTPPAPLVNAPSTSDAALENATPAQLYNAGVTAYRAKDFAAAREMFALAAAQGKADLAARSMYNRGTTQYAASVDAMAAAQAPGASAAPTPESQQQQQQQLMESLESALRELKDAARADPSNADARANAELAHRVLKELKKKQEQEKKDQQKQDQEQKDQQKQDQEQQDQEGKDQESKDPQSQEQKDQAKKDQEQKAQEKKDQDKKEQEQKKQDQQQEDQAKQEQQKQEQQQSQAEQAEKKPMSKQDVERLLQKIRDREKQRIQEKLVRERAKTQPAPKDW
ncbi:MAG: hypothetical protein DWH97_09365 [Planctomycetota bacterium]|nr:MAG: hypothetical protein DWH97_09365 [Planctomycetota bacterium]